MWERSCMWWWKIAGKRDKRQEANYEIRKREWRRKQKGEMRKQERNKHLEWRQVHRRMAQDQGEAK